MAKDCSHAHFAVLGSLCGSDPGRLLPLERLRALLLRGLEAEGSSEAQHVDVDGGLQCVGLLWIQSKVKMME